MTPTLNNSEMAFDVYPIKFELCSKMNVFFFLVIGRFKKGTLPRKIYFRRLI